MADKRSPRITLDTLASMAFVEGVGVYCVDRGEYAEPMVIAQAVNARFDLIGPSAGADSVEDAALAAYDAFKKRPYAKPRLP